MDFELSEEHRQVADVIREFGETEIKPFATAWDRDEVFPMETVKKLGRLGFLAVSLPEDVGGGMRINDELLGLDVALTRLADVDAKLAQVVELRYFAGLSEMEIATLLKRSERSIRRDWQKARMFLLASLKDS